MPTSFKLPKTAVLNLFQRCAGFCQQATRSDVLSIYDRWIRDCDTRTAEDRKAIVNHIRQFEFNPLISIVMSVHYAKRSTLVEAINSVLRQIYPHWELCIAVHASRKKDVVKVLCEYAGKDPRIKLVRYKTADHIVANTNMATNMAAGDFLAYMNHGDLLAEHALYEIAYEINMHPDVDIVYSDGDHLDARGRRKTPHFKTDWNRELMLGYNMLNHLCIFRRSLVEDVGRLREGFEGAMGYDLTLRVVDVSAPERIRHVPAVLYHSRQTSVFSETAEKRSASAARRAVEQHLQRRGEVARVDPHPIDPTWQRVRRKLPKAAPLVSLIVPTRDKVDILRNCVDGLLYRTNYKNLEVLIVDHQSCDPTTFACFSELEKDSRVRILRYEGAFNYSAINNFAAAQARGELIGLINNDIDVITATWLDQMVAQAVRPKVGAVGARLLYKDGRVQHAGIMMGVGDVAGHFCKYVAREDAGYFGRAVVASEVTAVTGACLVVRKAVYEEVGGLDAVNLPVAFNDVDLCLKIRAKGYINIFTPLAELFHLESASRGSDTTPERKALFEAEIRYMRKAWKIELARDPYYNDNMSSQSENFDLAFPRSRSPTWHKHESVLSGV